jgi:amidase
MIGRDPSLISDLLKGEIAHARALTADEQEFRRDVLRAAAIFTDRALEEYDVLVSLAAPGEAPRSLENTGDPAFNRLPSTAGLPAAGLPVGRGEHGLPLGLQLIGPPHSDQQLLELVTALTFEHGLSQVPDLPGGTR